MFGLLFYFLHVANFGITLSPSCTVRCPESAESLVLLPVLSALAPVAIMSRKETLLPGYYALKDSYLKLQRLLKKKQQQKTTNISTFLHKEKSDSAWSEPSLQSGSQTYRLPPLREHPVYPEYRKLQDIGRHTQGCL